MNIGNKIKEERQRLNISQDELADKVFVSRQTISNWENSKSYPDIKSLTLLSQIFNISLDELIQGEIKELQELLDTSKIKKLNTLGLIYTIELIVLLVSAYPILKFASMLGISLRLLFFIIVFLTALRIEKFKKENDIQTYKEIMAFDNEKLLNRDEKNQEIGKRVYQKIFLAISSAIVTIIIMLLMKQIIG